MKSSSALFLQAVIVLIGIAILGLMLWVPHLEGRNAHATTFEVYFKDPFLAYVYVGSIAFFVGLHRVCRLLGDVRRNGTFSKVSLDALRGIKRSATTLIVFVAGGLVFILMNGDGEDRPPGIFMCLLVALPASMVAIAATLAARKLQSALRRAEANQA